MKAISIKNLSYGYDKSRLVLDDISFDINKGEYIAVVGPNGSGKSTLARLLMGLIKPITGDIYLFDELVTKDNVKRLTRRMGMVFQNPDNQFIGATVEDDIAFGLENKSMERSMMKKTVEKYANLVSMSSFLFQEPSYLSGGQKQRVAIASVLALSPEIIIFDESTSMLDPKGKKEIISLLFKIKQENPSLTILTITHDVNETLYADKVMVIAKDKIVYFDTPEKVFSHERELKEMKINIPFKYELESKLKSKGIKINNDIKEALDKVCR